MRGGEAQRPGWVWGCVSGAPAESELHVHAPMRAHELGVGADEGIKAWAVDVAWDFRLGQGLGRCVPGGVPEGAGLSFLSSSGHGCQYLGVAAVLV